MKKIIIVLLVVAFMSPAVFAQITDDNVKAYVGKIVNVTVADPAKGITAGTITVLDETGKSTTFTVKSTAKILTHAVDVVTLNQLKVGEKVKINPSKDNEAQSIKVVN